MNLKSISKFHKRFIVKKPPIVILHGWGLSGERFAPLRQLLEKHGYTVFAPDLPGFGKTDPPLRPLHLSDYAEFLREYMQKNNIVNPVLIGHSFGGRVSLKYQKLFPKTIRALILTGTPGYTPVARKKIIIFVTIAKIGKFFLSFPLLIPLQENIRKWYYYVVGARDFTRAEGVMREIFKNIVREDLVSCMESIQDPCLLVWGENDRITPLWIARRMNTVIGGSQLVVIPDIGHGVPFQQPHRFVEAIENFLKTI
jgi:pimeloyl-ACP methyl ester carboxylesterase